MGVARPLFSSSAVNDPFVKPLLDEDYVAVGLACCFARNDENKLSEAWILEPLTAGTLETIEKGIETSYKQTLALRARDFFEGDLNDPSGVNVENLEALSDGFPDVTLCSNIIERSMAASRTFRRREEAKLLDFNEMSDEYNFSTDRKRILNQIVEVNFDDNVKQDKSIDVYGRSDDSDGDDSLNKEIER